MSKARQMQTAVAASSEIHLWYVDDQIDHIASFFTALLKNLPTHPSYESLKYIIFPKAEFQEGSYPAGSPEPKFQDLRDTWVTRDKRDQWILERRSSQASSTKDVSRQSVTLVCHNLWFHFCRVTYSAHLTLEQFNIRKASLGSIGGRDAEKELLEKGTKLICKYALDHNQPTIIVCDLVWDTNKKLPFQQLPGVKFLRELAKQELAKQDPTHSIRRFATSGYLEHQAGEVSAMVAQGDVIASFDKRFVGDAQYFMETNDWQKFFEHGVLPLTIKLLPEERLTSGELAELNKARLGFHVTPGLHEPLKTALQISKEPMSVLITGESGCGKEIIAKVIHACSNRSGAFIDINCAAMPETLIESELFGHEKGAFTDARTQRIGKFEEANGGTLFLDEIGEMSPALQTKLLRVLEQKTFSRLGGATSASINSDCRLICATNKDMPQAVKLGEFRQDLYYRINEVTIEVKSLSERPDDIEELARFFLRRSCETRSLRELDLTPQSILLLKQYRWPGNVRQLRSVIELSALFSGTGPIQPQHLTKAFKNQNPQPKSNLQLRQELQDLIARWTRLQLSDKATVRFDTLAGYLLYDTILQQLNASVLDEAQAKKLLALHGGDDVRATLRRRLKNNRSKVAPDLETLAQ